MSLRICPLASGSRGNAVWVEADGVAMLVDCGLGPRVLEQRLAARGFDRRRLAAVLVTHEHFDHIGGLGQFTGARRVALRMTRGTLRGSAALAGASGLRVEAEHAFAVGPLTVTPLAIPHDAGEPVAYRFAAGGAAALILTDLGEADALPAWALRDLDYLLIEANHDERRLREGPYPAFLKARIAGASGHLSNAQCGELLARIVALSPRLRRVTLGHLSETNNDAGLAVETVWAGLEARPGAASPLTVEVATQREPGVIWESR